MALETGTYIDDLVATNPVTGDQLSQADDHLRWIKSAILASFPNITGAMTATHDILNGLDGRVTAIEDDYIAVGPGIEGLELANDVTDAAHDVVIATGRGSDGTRVKTLVLAAALTKQIDFPWAVGTDAGGLDTGTVGASTWYHVWLIERSDTGVIDALFSLSATAPTMPTDYDFKRRIGAVVTDASSNIVAFWQTGNHVLWDVPAQDYNANLTGTNRVLRTLSVPLGVKAIAKHTAGFYTTNDSGETYYLVIPTWLTDTTPSATVYTLHHGASGGAEQVMVDIMVDTSGQIATRSTSSSGLDYHTGMTHGYEDPRGRW
jgi:hypothetical protein